MGFIADLFSGSKGAGFQAASAPIVAPTNGTQIDRGYNENANAMALQGAFLQALSGQNGINNQSDVYNRQVGLANTLQNYANGNGPNPALAQLNQTTGNNIAATNALLAGVRGGSANAGLLGRQAAMQGANTQQNAVGQAATLSAQQQLGFLQALQTQNNSLGNLATTQVGQQANAVTNFNQENENTYGALLSSLGQFNNANVANTGSQNSANAAIAGGNQKAQSGILGGIGAFLGLAHGGEVPRAGDVPPPAVPAPVTIRRLPMLEPKAGEPSSSVAKFLMGAFSEGGNVGATLKEGGEVPGKAKVPGDSLKNDTVNAKLSPDEIVIPRSIAMGPDPVNNAAKFVAAVLMKKKKKPGMELAA